MAGKDLVGGAWSRREGARVVRSQVSIRVADVGVELAAPRCGCRRRSSGRQLRRTRRWTRLSHDELVGGEVQDEPRSVAASQRRLTAGVLMGRGVDRGRGDTSRSAGTVGVDLAHGNEPGTRWRGGGRAEAPQQIREAAKDRRGQGRDGRATRPPSGRRGVTKTQTRHQPHARSRAPAPPRGQPRHGARPQPTPPDRQRQDTARTPHRANAHADEPKAATEARPTSPTTRRRR